MKRSVSVAIRSVDVEGVERVVAVLRPKAADDPLGGLWGLPAATIRENETAESAVARVLRDKMGLESSTARFERINEGRRDAEDGQLQSMTVYGMAWDEKTPLPVSLPAASPDASVTLYEDWRWAAPEELREAARRGSLCTRLYLEWLGTPG